MTKDLTPKEKVVCTVLADELDELVEKIADENPSSVRRIETFDDAFELWMKNSGIDKRPPDTVVEHIEERWNDFHDDGKFFVDGTEMLRRGMVVHEDIEVKGIKDDDLDKLKKLLFVRRNLCGGD